MKRVVVNMATSRKERFKLYKAKKRWLIAGLAFAGVAMMSGGQVSADQVSDAQVEPAKTAVSTQPDPSAATGAVVTPTSATLTTGATTTESTDQEAAAKPVSNPVPAVAATTPVAATTEVSTDKAVTDKPAVQPQATTQAPAQSTTAPVADTTQDNGQQATTDANTAHTWDYATDADVQTTVEARITGAVNSKGEVIANGGNFTQSDQWNTARVDNGYSVTVTIHNESGKYKNGDTIRIPISGEMSSDVAGVAKQKFDVRETQGTLMNGNVALGTYTIADGYFSIKLTQDLFGESTSDLTISGTSGSAPVARSAIWMNKTGSATITFGNSSIKGKLEFTVQPKATNGASATQKLNTASDKIGVQSSFQDNNYLGALYSGDAKSAKNDEAGSFNQDIVQIQHIVIEQGTVRSVSLDRTYTSLYVPMIDENGNIVASAVSAADVTLNIGKEIQINLDSSIDDVTAMESAIAKSLKNKGVGSYAIVQLKDGSYIVAYNIGNPYTDYSTADVLNNVEFTKFLKDGNNQGLLTDAQLNQLKTNIALASAGKDSVGIGAIAHIFNVNFASNDTPNEVTSTLDTYDVNGNNLANWGDKDVTTTPDKQDYNGQARLVVSFLDDKGHVLDPDDSSLAKSGVGYTKTPNDIPGYTFSYVHGVADGVYGPANETTSVIFYYKANPQVVEYNVIDDTDQKNLVSNAVFDEGVTAGELTKTKADLQTIANEFAKQGYVVASVDDVPTTFNDGTTPQVVNIHLTHRVDTVDPKTPGVPDQPINPEDPNSPKWPNEVTKDKLTKTVNETIHYVYAKGGTAADDKKDAVSFSRTATVDAVTGKFIAYGEWTADDNDTTFDAVKSPVIAGYTANGDVAAVTGLTADHEDVTATVTYTADTQHATVTYIDEVTGEHLSVDHIDGDSNTKSNYTTDTKIKDYEKQGYKFASSNFPDDGLTFDTDDDKSQDYTVKFTHDTTKTDTPQTPGTPIDPKNPNGPKWPDEVTKDKLTKTVNETIHYVYAGGAKAADDKTDKVSFSRTATVDAVTGKFIAYGEWTADDNDTTFDAVTSPVIAGYTANGDVPAFTGLTADHEDINETVTYTADDQKVVYNVIDDTTGETLVSKKLFDEGVTAGELKKTKADLQTIANDFVKQGYDIVSVGDVPGVFDNDDKTDQVVDVHLKHRVDTVDPKTPGVPDQPINPEDPKSPKWPNEVIKDKLTKTVNETIHYVYAKGGTAADDKTDKVSFSRTATVDAVTGKFIAYGEWTADDNDTTFDAVESPVIAGYTASGDVPAFTGLTADHEDVTKTVTYTADEQKVVYNVIDDTTGKELVSKKLFDEGVTAGELKKTKADLQTIANDFVKQGYNVVLVDDVPATFDNDDDTDQVVNIHLTHTMKPVTVENQLDVKVTEIVHYVYQDGTTVAPDVTDTVEFTRTGIIDEATDVVTYTDWTAVNGDNSFDTKVSPVITGYVADKANVAEVDGLTSASKNVEETVTYSKLGSYVPELPDGSTPSVPYPNDPTDPSKPGTDVPVMPHVPGYTPVGPDGKPLTPVDPQDPSKGYNPPAVPSDPTTDTVIKYGADKQNVVYNVINDTTGENLATNVLFDSGDTDAALTKGQADLQAIADAYIEQGYDVVSVDTVPGSFDDDDTVDQIVNIHLKNKTATAMVPNEPIRVVTAMVPNEPVYATPVVVPNGPVNVPTSVVTGDNTTRVGKAVTNTPTKLGATSGSSVVITRADDNAKAKNSVATSNTVSLPDTAAKGNQDENALLVALAVIASLLTFGFVQKRK